MHEQTKEVNHEVEQGKKYTNMMHKKMDKSG